ncbi:MAG: DUF2066 domain-containing protein [Gammaproteobacteria bacterium]|nr:DUF2066 domain-containing protein [Gammaproteobacteria bacterium]
MQSKLVFFIVLLVTLPLSVHAEIVKQLFETSLPVTSQDQEVRQVAFEQGFREILVRVSGSSETPSQLNIQAASRYVQQYRYFSVEKKIEPKATEVDQLEPKYRLWIQFNESKIINLLKQSSLSVWGAQRPKVLLWLSVKDGRNRYILREKDMSVIKEAAEKEARRRGLPIAWPIYDEVDKKQVTFFDISGQFWGPVSQASLRYSVDAIVLCRMSWDGSIWHVDWSLKLDEQTSSKRVQEADLDMLMAQGIDFVADQVAGRFAVVDDIMDEGHVVIQINGVEDVDTYSRVMHYLSSIASVKHIFPLEFDQDWVKFYLDLSGNEKDLQRLISLGRVLDRVELPEIVTRPQPGDQAASGKIMNTSQNPSDKIEDKTLFYKIR